MISFIWKSRMGKFTEIESRLDFPGDAVKQWIGIRPPIQGTRVNPWSVKILHASEQLSLQATITEPKCWNYWSLHAYAPKSEKPMQGKEG